MTIALKDVEAASFWDLDVCLECESIVQSDGRFCPNCGTSPTIPSKTIVQIFDVVKAPEED